MTLTAFIESKSFRMFTSIPSMALLEILSMNKSNGEITGTLNTAISVALLFVLLAIPARSDCPADKPMEPLNRLRINQPK